MCIRTRYDKSQGNIRTDHESSPRVVAHDTPLSESLCASGGGPSAEHSSESATALAGTFYLYNPRLVLLIDHVDGLSDTGVVKFRSGYQNNAT